MSYRAQGGPYIVKQFLTLPTLVRRYMFSAAVQHDMTLVCHAAYESFWAGSKQLGFLNRWGPKVFAWSCVLLGVTPFSSRKQDHLH